MSSILAPKEKRRRRSMMTSRSHSLPQSMNEFNHGLVAVKIPGSRRTMLAMPGSRPVSMAKVTQASETFSRSDSNLSDSVNVNLHAGTLRFEDSKVENAYTQHCAKDRSWKMFRLCIGMATLEAVRVVDYKLYHNPIELQLLLIVFHVAYFVFLAIASKLEIIHFSKPRNEIIAAILMLVPAVFTNISISMNDLDKSVFFRFAVSCLMLMLPSLNPFKFVYVWIFPPAMALSAIIYSAVSGTFNFQIYDVAVAVFFLVLSTWQIFVVERSERQTWVAEKEQNKLLRRNTALRANLEIAQQSGRRPSTHSAQITGVVKELKTLSSDLNAIGNHSAARMIDIVIFELSHSFNNQAPKFMKMAGGIENLDETGGYLELMMSRRGYEDTKFRSTFRAKTTSSKGRESLSADNGSSGNSIPYNWAYSNKGHTRRHTTTATDSLHTAEELMRRKKDFSTIPLEYAHLRVTFPALTARMHDWNFGEGGIFNAPEECRDHELMYVMHYVFTYYGLFQRLEVIPSVFHRYFANIERLYGNVSYHNRFHAADVVQTTFWMLSEAEIDHKEGITVNTIFASLVGAAVHDVGHPGQGNSYHVNVENNYALHFNDIHVLENMHLFTAFDLMRNEKMNIMVNFEPLDRKEIRQFMIDAVIATDLTLHFEKIAKFKTMVEENSVNLTKAEDSSELICALLHAADVSSPAKKWDVYQVWVDRVFHEFLAQGDLEKAADISPAPFMDRDQSVPPKAQLGFINFIVKPLFDVLVQYAPKTQIALTILEENSEHLKKWEMNFDPEYCQKLKNRDDLIPPNSVPVKSNARAHGYSASSEIQRSVSSKVFHDYTASDRQRMTVNATPSTRQAYAEEQEHDIANVEDHQSE